MNTISDVAAFLVDLPCVEGFQALALHHLAQATREIGRQRAAPYYTVHLAVSLFLNKHGMLLWPPGRRRMKGSWRRTRFCQCKFANAHFHCFASRVREDQGMQAAAQGQDSGDGAEGEAMDVDEEVNEGEIDDEDLDNLERFDGGDALSFDEIAMILAQYYEKVLEKGGRGALRNRTELRLIINGLGEALGYVPTNETQQILP